MIADLLYVTPVGADAFTGPANGPEGKRAFGGLLGAQALAAACGTVESEKLPTAMHLQFLRAGDAGVGAHYDVERVHDGRTTSSRRVLVGQDGRLLVTATVLFATPDAGPSHSDAPCPPSDPETLARTGPIGPAPALPLDEIDIRLRDEIVDGEFVRSQWWRVTGDLPDDPRVHLFAAVFVTDIYGVDPVLAVHGHSMFDGSHRSATTDASIWFHAPVHADQWNLLQSRSPAAGRGRGVMTAGLFSADGSRVATMVHEGQAVTRVES